MQETLVTAIVGMMLLVHAPATVQADATQLAQADATKKAPAPATGEKGEAGPAKSKTMKEQVTVKGTISALDKDKSTVTLKGPGGRTITLDVQDKQKFDAIAVGDPVVATYTKAWVVQIKKAGTSTPGVTVQETRTGSKPGENPAGAVGQEISVTATITAIDRKANTVTIKGPEGRTETITARDPKNLEGVKVGDLVEITYRQALAVRLDKPTK
jgi:hypothetical protein